MVRSDADVRGNAWKVLVAGDEDIKFFAIKTGVFGRMACTYHDCPFEVTDSNVLTISDLTVRCWHRRHEIAAGLEAFMEYGQLCISESGSFIELRRFLGRWL